ncbi:MAG: DNA mismatch repair endonuclease MutL [Thermoplasmatota archaeon]
MARRIRVLDQGTVNKIAAGEVVESPSSVVKELVENSLDAGAVNIKVQIDGGGLRRISVIDDGVGMSREDVEVAFTRHTTSKIQDIEDLGKLDTLGFRGEALASIGAVSQVELITRERGSEGESGTRAAVSAGRMLSIEPAGCPEGTTITVKDLFENVPARKKFLRSVNAEKARCMDILSRIMMVRPRVGFIMEVDGEERINSPGTSDLRKRVSAVFGIKTARSMLDLPVSVKGPIWISGLVSLPWDTRSNSGGITLAVHGRVVRNRSLVEAIKRGYGSRLMKGRFPLGVVMIDIAMDQVDVNVHPTKDIVKFSNEGEVQNALESAVTVALFSSTKKFSKDKFKEAPSPRPPPELVKAPEGGLRIDRSPVQVPLMDGEVRPMETGADPWAEVPVVEGIKRLPPALPEDASGSKVRIIGQLDRSYILCEIGPDLLLIDQHAAHERIRLEALKGRYNQGNTGIQELLEPIHIELDPVSIENLKALGPGLGELGFLLEPFGDDCIVIRGLPQFMGRTEAHTVITDLLTGNESHEGCSPPDIEFQPKDLPIKERLLALTACRGAIKAHDGLSLREMEDLILDLLRCEVPLHCAHGRPTMVRLPLSILEKWFRRVL